jgi:outer membrane protein OmpA-like peptidoglycan-associated protein
MPKKWGNVRRAPINISCHFISIINLNFIIFYALSYDFNKGDIMRKFLLLITIVIVNPLLANNENQSERIGFTSGLVVGGIACGPFCSLLASTLGVIYGENDDIKTDKIDSLSEDISKQNQINAHLADENYQSQAELNILSDQLLSMYQDISNHLAVDLLFTTNTSALTDDAKRKLETLVKIGQSMESIIIVPVDVSIKVDGYSDFRGSEQDNLMLSEQRAIAVKEHLVSSGFPEAKVRIDFFGETYSDSEIENPEVFGLDRKVTLSLRVNRYGGEQVFFNH